MTVALHGRMLRWLYGLCHESCGRFGWRVSVVGREGAKERVGGKEMERRQRVEEKGHRVQGTE